MRREEIKNIFYNVGFEIVGLTDLDCNRFLSRYLESEKLGYYNHLIKGKPSERNINSDFKSAIVVGLTYTKESSLIKQNKPYFGNSSWGMDYHRVMNDKLLSGVNELLKNTSFKYEVICDTSNFDDRSLAYKAGLGWFGKNGLLINPKLGSYFFIGAILLDFELESDQPIENMCGECNKCLKACPNGAINETGLLNSYECRSYITQSKDEVISDIGYSVFGCDICARVCPYNKDINHEKNIEFLPTGIEQVESEISLSNKEFVELYGHLSGSYIGKKRINRNIKTIKEKNSMLK